MFFDAAHTNLHHILSGILFQSWMSVLLVFLWTLECQIGQAHDLDHGRSGPSQH